MEGGGVGAKIGKNEAGCDCCGLSVVGCQSVAFDNVCVFAYLSSNLTKKRLESCNAQQS